MTVAIELSPSVGYVLGSSLREHERLLRQNRLLAPISRHWIETVGLWPGMRILDVGSGVGDMALLLATVAGPTAEIIGIDLDEGAMDVARRRVSERKLQRVSFHLSNLHLYESDAQFDAIIGRNILIHQSDPVSAVKSLTRHLRSGGIVAFQELWLSQIVCYPMIPLLNKLVSWIVATFKAAGLDPDLGAHLPRIFTSAGLAYPDFVL